MGKKLNKLKREVKELRRVVKPVRSAGARAKAKLIDAAPKKPLKISDDILFLSASRDKARIDSIAQRIYAAAQPMPGVVPSGHDINQAGIKLACDAAADSIGQQIIFAGGWGGSFGGYGAFAEGQAFLGYPYLAELAQRPEYRVIAEVPATEMFRKGITFKTSEAAVTIKPPAPKISMIGAAPPPPPQEVADPKAAKLKELEKEFERLRVLENLQEVVEQDAFFGRSHLYLDFDDAYANADELLTSVGDGQNYTTGAKVAKGSFKRLACVEAMWCYPSAYNSNNPLAPDWYKPQQWFAMGKRLDASRLLTFVGREVPDILKPAYAFGGLAMSQMAKPYVDNWLRTRQSVSDLLHAFTVWHLSTDLSAMMQEGGAETLGRRLAIFNNFRDNKGVFLTNDDTEEFANVSAPLGTLDKLQAQAQEQMCVSKGTLVETNRGQVPIEQMTVQDKVMTRGGFAPINWVECTGFASRMVEIKTANSTLKVTEDHPIWDCSTNEFVSARNVNLSHRLLGVTKVQNTDRRLHGVDVGGRFRKLKIIQKNLDITETPKLAAYCIELFTKRTLDLFHKVTTCITKMMIQSTIGLIISNRLLVQNIHQSTFVSDLIFTTVFDQENALFVEYHSWPYSAEVASPQCIVRADVNAPHIEIESVRLLDQEIEPVFNISVADGFLPEFYANGILIHNCTVAKIPKVKLLGLDPAGLNASSEGEIETFDDTIISHRKKLVNPKLDVIFRFAQINLWGEVDPDISYEWPPLDEMNEKEKADIRKIDADTDLVLIDGGVIDASESRSRVAKDKDSPYSDLDPNKVVVPPQEMMPNMGKPNQGGGIGGGNPFAEAAE